MECHPHSYGLGLSAIRATTADVGGFSFLAVLVYVADEDPAIDAGTRTLQAGVVSLYGVVVIVSGWVRVSCARLSSVHSFTSFSVGRVPGSCHSCGTISLSDGLILAYWLSYVYYLTIVSLLYACY